jgi:putative heme-binding domain-containing protein
VLALATRMAADPSPAIRREAALSLRDIKSEQCIPVLVKIASQFDGRDRSYLEALGLGSEGREGAVFTALAPSFGQDPLTWSDAAVWIAWRLHPVEAVSAFQTRALSAKLNQDQRRQMLTALAFVKTREAAGAMIELANAKDFPQKDLAKWWLFNRKGNDWRAYDVEGGMKALGLYDPAKVQLVAMELPAEPANAPALPPGAEIAKLTGDASRGQAAIAVCYSCHTIGGTGIDFGPELTTFGQQQPTEVIAQAIANPSADISHGFEGSEIKTKDGLTITGMVLSNGDPVIIKCMGGTVQTVPRERIASLAKLERSLMYSPATLNLTPQGIADIVSFLKNR